MTYQTRRWITLHNMRTTATIPVALLALVLTGCSSTPATVSTPDATPATDCIEVSGGVATALTNGIDDDAVKLTQYAATPSADTDGLWYVAAQWDDGTNDGEAVWITQQDPTGNDAAFLSVDAVAETISMYNRLEGGTAAAPGAQAATACLN